MVSNADGVLCGNYPSRLIIPVQEVSTPTSQVVDTDADDVDVNQRYMSEVFCSKEISEFVLDPF